MIQLQPISSCQQSIDAYISDLSIIRNYGGDLSNAMLQIQMLHFFSDLIKVRETARY